MSNNNPVQIAGHGNNADLFTQVDNTHKAFRTSIRPWEHDSGGHYRIATRTAALTGAGVTAGGPVFSFQWNPTGGFLAALLRLKAFYIPTVAFTAAQEIGLALKPITGFTTTDTAGTTVVPQKLRVGMPTSQASNVQMAIATIITAGAAPRTVGNAFEIGGGVVNIVNAAAGTAYINPNSGGSPAYGFDYDPLMRGEMPHMMSKGEGFQVENTVGFPAAGTCTLVVVAHVVEFPAAAQLIIVSG